MDIKLVSADGARWIKSCIDQHLPHTERCIDGVHVVVWAIEAMDKLGKIAWMHTIKQDKFQPKSKKGRRRRGEGVVKQNPRVKGSKYALGKNPENLTLNQKGCLDDIRNQYPILFRAYQLNEGPKRVFQCTGDTVKKELESLRSWSCRCSIPVFVELS